MDWDPIPKHLAELSITPNVLDYDAVQVTGADIDGIDADEDLIYELDIDSMDFLNFVIAVPEKTGIEIPERDYPKLSSLNKAVGYLQAAMG
jgi:acyl carrier protein